MLMLSKMKLEVSFPTRQFRMKDFAAPYRLVRNGSVGGILIYVRKDTPSKLLALFEWRMVFCRNKSQEMKCFTFIWKKKSSVIHKTVD